MATFLVKTEPTDYSLDDFTEDEFTTWDGVRNPQAVSVLRQMQPGDRVLIYHSGAETGIVGQAQVVDDPTPDVQDSRSWIVTLKYLCHFDEPVSLRDIKDCGLFDDWALVRQGRLSVMAVPESFLIWFWDRVGVQ